jgi:tRNA-specific 2-thiouridylase
MNSSNTILEIEGLARAATPQAAPAETTVVVAMSGGVDSSAVAAMLASDGYRVIGVTMQLWDQNRLGLEGGSSTGRCCSLIDVYDARRVAEHLKVPYYVVNFQRNFEETVVRPFVAEYLAGRTPIPCTLCNNHVKFDQLLVTARQIGAEKLATGHYARVEYDARRQRYLLRRAVDETKDQSYFLFGLTQEQLSRTMFPLGSLSKQSVREAAREFKLPVAEKPESQEICFVPTGDYSKFMEAYRREQGDPMPQQSGEVMTADGEVLAHHDGLHKFTVGQRKGLGVATGTPLYVISLDPAKRRVTVGHDAELYAGGCTVRDMNWIAMEKPEAELRAEVKIRHKHTPAPATVFCSAGTVRVRFDTPQRALTPGQAAVFYQGDLVVGGGWIDCVER